MYNADCMPSLEDIESYQIACLPKENSFDLIKMIRFKIRTAVTRINAAMYSDPYMLDIALLSGRNKSPAILQKMFMGLGGNQVTGFLFLYIHSRVFLFGDVRRMYCRMSLFRCRHLMILISWYVDYKFVLICNDVQVLDTQLVECQTKRPKKHTATQQTLQDGFNYIRDNGPRANNQNQMTEWCWS